MIWVVNVSVPHCTCEMSAEEESPLRSTLAVFSKFDTVKAAARTHAYVSGNGAAHGAAYCY